MPDDDRSPPDDDKYRPDAIAARIDKLGTESEADRHAREEEQKLFERRRERKTGLESAASKRLAKIGEGKVKRPTAAAAAMSGDPLFDRANSLQQWLRKNQTLAVSGGVAALLVIGGIVGVGSWREHRDAQASVFLAKAMADERGHIASDSTKDDSDGDTPARSLYPTFKSAAERRDAALAQYRAVQAKFGGTGAAILARLAEASILLDTGDAKGALAAYNDVRQSALASVDVEVRGRAIEGNGFVHELLARTDRESRDKHLDDALAEFKSLEAVGGDFKDLGAYHQARLHADKGDRAKAIEILKDLDKRVAHPSPEAPSYLQLVVEDRLRDLDPNALPPKPARGLAGAAGGGPADPLGGLGGGEGPSHIDMNDPRIQDLLRQLKEHPQQGGPPGPAGSAAP
ncbi:MAG: tetratricopeptide repeat protein [Polyangiaceae bacterium]|nr:tetratricopeptide repeat protein [Polyangiaceae bacterium]